MDYETMYRELQLRMYAQQQQQQGGMRHPPGGSPHPHSPHPPPLPPGRVPPSSMPGPGSPGDHSHAAALTAEALRHYQAAHASGGANDGDDGDDAMTGGWEEGDDEDSSTTTDGSKQSVARRRHARRRRQLARLAADKMEWESRSRQMEAALRERGGDLSLAGLDADASRSDASLFADFRAALARALLITEQALDREETRSGVGADGDRWTENKTGTNTTNTEHTETAETAESDELASRLLEELRDDDDDALPRRRSFERRRASCVASDAPFFGSVSFANFLSSFARNDRGVMVSPAGRAFDGRVAGMEAVAALEHGLLKAEASGLFAPGELLVTAVSTKDMLTCYAGGGCENVLGAPAESFIHTSLLDGLHAEDVRNLVFAFHLFPTILPEVINTLGPRRAAPAAKKGSSPSQDATENERSASDENSDGRPRPEAWAKERAKMRMRAAHDAEGVLPLPDAAQLLPHGYLRRRLADGRFVAMERLGGMIVSNDTAMSVLEEARRPSVEELSTLFGGGNRSPENNSPPEPRTHSLSSLERAPSSAERDAALVRRDAGAAALGADARRPASLDETKVVTGEFDAMALVDGKETAATASQRRRAPAKERPYPGSAAKDARPAPGDAPPPPPPAAAASSVVLNKYHPSAKRDAKSDALALGRSAVSAPSAGRPRSGDPSELSALSPAASSFAVPSSAGAAGAKILSGPAPPSSAPPASTVEAAAKARQAAEEASDACAASKDAEERASAEAPAESASTDAGEAGKEEEEKAGATYAAPTGATVALNKYHPSKKRESTGTTAKAVPAARIDSRTTEAELSSLVAHCVRHTEKATPGPRKEPVEESLPEGIKDVLRRLTGETFSEHTVLVTIERVRGIGGNAGSEARHNAQMMVVSKLLNDLATRRHRAMPSSAA